MISKTKTRACKRRLLGGAGMALALTLAAFPAYAQAVSGHATGDTVLTNSQSTSGGITLARGDGAAIESVVAGPITGSTIALDRNKLAASARANSASQAMALDSASPPASRSTALAAGATAINAQANTLIANQQSLTGEAVADIVVSPISISVRDVVAGTIALTANEQSASAAGNAATGTLAATWAGGGGAGIVSSQTSGSASGVAARVRRGLTIDTAAISGSALTISGNSNHADAAGNTADNDLSVSGGAINAPLQPGFASRVPAIGVGDPSVSAGFAVLSDQKASGVAKARAGNLVDGIPDGGPAIRTSVGGDANDASLASDGNTISATSAANRSANRVSLSAPTLSSAPAGSGAIGSVTNVQSATGAAIVATAHGGVATDVTGQFADSTLSISQNQRQTSAIGNDATDNRLTVDAATVQSAPGSASNTIAVTGPSGDAVADAGFTVQSVQDYATSTVSSMQAGPAVRATVGRALLGSAVSLTGNSGTATAIGNSAANAAQLTVTTLGTSASVNNVQSGNGSVTSELGTVADPDGVVITPQTSVSGSTFTVAGSDTTGSAIGNAASNVLDVSAATIRGNVTSGVAGAVGADYGARGTLAVANSQKLGQMSLDDSLTPTIASDVVSVGGVTGSGSVSGSTILVDGNRQRAEALGNSAGNRLTLSAATLDTAGAALSSSQYGQANVTARSLIALGGRGDLTGSSASLAGNSNVALGVINDAVNALDADAAMDSIQTGAFVSVGPLGPPFARGAVALASQQFATGSVDATAVSDIGNVPSAAGLTDSRFTVEDNTNIAESAGNRVANALGIDTAGATGPSTALANSQTNMSQVGASAVTHAGYALTVPTPGPVGGSTIAIIGNTSSALARGNAADNAMTVVGVTGSGISASADLRSESAQGNAVLLNGQANYGAVIASAEGASYRVPLNAADTISGTTVTLDGNSIGASAYGNSASNSIALSTVGARQGAGIANFQTNYGGVTALVSGTGYQTSTGPVTGSALTITGNSLAATAVGNQATSAIASPR